MFFDLDRFKPINDTYGHRAGDLMLQEVARRLQVCTRKEDLVARLGGDEFVILLSQLPATEYRGVAVAQHLLEALARPFRIGSLELQVTPSIGISWYPEHGDNLDSLIRAADLAMYQAKQAGRSNVRTYTSDLERQAEKSLSIEMQLKRALTQGGLVLHYQPVVDIHSGQLVAAEALLRMRGADGAERTLQGTMVPRDEDGERLFDGVDDLALTPVETLHSPHATHVRYRVER